MEFKNCVSILDLFKNLIEDFPNFTLSGFLEYVEPSYLRFDAAAGRTILESAKSHLRNEIMGKGTDEFKVVGHRVYGVSDLEQILSNYLKYSLLNGHFEFLNEGELFWGSDLKISLKEFYLEKETADVLVLEVKTEELKKQFFKEIDEVLFICLDDASFEYSSFIESRFLGGRIPAGHSSNFKENIGNRKNVILFEKGIARVIKNATSIPLVSFSYPLDFKHEYSCPHESSPFCHKDFYHEESTDDE